MEEKVLYVGIDVAKAKFDVSITIDGISCIYYQTIENEKGGFKKLVKEIKKIQKKFKIKKVHICMEATGIFLKLFSLKPVIRTAVALSSLRLSQTGFYPYTISLPLRAL